MVQVLYSPVGSCTDDHLATRELGSRQLAIGVARGMSAKLLLFTCNLHLSPAVVGGGEDVASLHWHLEVRSRILRNFARVIIFWLLQVLSYIVVLRGV